jgi:hypothetical protein
MEQLTNSRFITYPSLEPNSSNHKVVLVDAEPVDIEDIGLYLKTNQKNYDVYLYKGDTGDLEWLNEASREAEIIINDASQVSVTPSGIRYGAGLDLIKPLDYFVKNESQNS